MTCGMRNAASTRPRLHLCRQQSSPLLPLTTDHLTTHETPLRASVIVFPGSNCDRDVKVALEAITGRAVNMVWHGDTSVPVSDIIVLPGVLQRNASLKFVCRDSFLKVERADTYFTRRYKPGEIINLPVAHGDGNFFADQRTLDRIEGDGQVVFRYVDRATGKPTREANPNGAQRNIAGICDATRRIVGLMPHPERHFDRILGSDDGRRVFESAMMKAAA